MQFQNSLHLSNIIISAQEMYQIKRKIVAYNHPVRLQIIAILQNEGSMNVTDLFVKMRMEQSIVSQHLRILRDADLVVYDQSGKYHDYSINTEGMKNLKTLIRSVSDKRSIENRLKQSFNVFRALAHDLRLEILQFIFDRKGSYVQPIYLMLELEQSITSQHLAIMRRAGIVKTNRTGKHVKYTVNTDYLKSVQEAVNLFYQFTHSIA